MSELQNLALTPEDREKATSTIQAMQHPNQIGMHADWWIKWLKRSMVLDDIYSGAGCVKLETKLAAADKMQKALLGLLNPFKDDPCYYDHHGNCQAHFVSNPCPVKQAKEALKAYEEAGK